MSAQSTTGKKDKTNFPRQPQYVTTHPANYTWESLGLAVFIKHADESPCAPFCCVLCSRGLFLRQFLRLTAAFSDLGSLNLFVLECFSAPFLSIKKTLFARGQVSVNSSVFTVAPSFHADVSCLPSPDHSPIFLDRSQAGF